MNFNEMTTAELVNFIKAAGFTPQTGYGQFVKHRDLRPEISMKQFVVVWNNVSGVVNKTAKQEPFVPTHLLKEQYSDVEKEIMILSDTPVILRWRWAFGEGGTPKQFVEYLKPLEQK